MSVMKWGIICSVPDFTPDVETELRTFGEWLIDELEDHSSRFYLYHYFAESPTFCFHSKPADKEAIYSAYERIYREHSDVLYVLHILPEKNSLEFRLMKDLTLNYALIGQGVLLDKARSKFEGVEMESVLANMNQYIMRRMSQLITFQRTENKFRFTINGNDENVAEVDNSAPQNQTRYHDIFMEKCVETVLHSADDDGCAASMLGDSFEVGGGADLAAVRDSPETLIIEGFPAVYNKFQVASLFSNPAFRPISVFITAKGRAYVEFTNKFHAAQAALYYIRDAAGIAANAEMDVHLRMRCANASAQKCLERRIAKSANAKRSEMDASILASPASSA